MHVVNEARKALQTAVLELASAEYVRTGIRPVPTALVGPQSYEDLCASVKEAWETGYLPIWNVANDRSIYGPTGVISFRFWHDMGHVEHGKTFTFEDEKALQEEIQIGQVTRSLDRQGLHFEVFDLALKMLWANTIGQLEYGIKFGGFPADQNRFDTDYALGLWEGRL